MPDLPPVPVEDIAAQIDAPIFPRIATLEKTMLHMPEMKLDELVAMYIAERNQLAVDRHAWEAREAQIKEHLQAISTEMLDRGNKMGVDSFKTDAGTAYRNTKRSFSIGDWDKVVEYIKQTGNYHILQKRLSPNAVKEIEEADAKLPPGIDPFVEVEFAVRSPVARRSSNHHRQE